MPARSSNGIHLRAAAARALGFAFLWWVLVEGDPRSAWLGAATVAVAVAVSLRVLPPSPRLPSLGAAGAFLAYFLGQSLRSGVAVATLALSPALRLEPQLRRLSLRLPPGPGRVLLADTISLLPGTLSAGLEGDCLTVHVLDRRLVTEADLDTAQKMVLRLLGAA